MMDIKLWVDLWKLNQKKGNRDIEADHQDVEAIAESEDAEGRVRQVVEIDEDLDELQSGEGMTAIAGRVHRTSIQKSANDYN